MKKYPRSKLLGHKLDKECLTANTTNEGNQIVCYGKGNPDSNHYCDKCKNCPCLVWNYIDKKEGRA